MPVDKPRLTFISYSRADGEFALQLAQELRSSGFQIWLDQLDIPTGAHWDDEIEKALEQCQIFMVILTPDSTASDNVKDEISFAIDSGKRILPVLLENAKLPLRLRRLQYVDFTSKTSREGVDSAKRLLKKLLDNSAECTDDFSTEPKTPTEILKERQREEANRKAREQDQARRRSMQIHEDPPREIRNPQERTRKQPVPGLLSIGIGAAFLLMIFIAGGWFALNFVFPTSTPTPQSDMTPVMPTVPPVEPTITTRPDLPATEETPILTALPSVTDTPSIQFPDEPGNLLYFYFEHINNGDYDTTWSLLSERFIAEFNPSGKEEYARNWSNMGHVEIYSAEVTKTSDNAAVVVVVSNLQTAPMNMYLIRDDRRNTWIFDPLPSSLNVSCSRAPRTLSVGIDAIVSTRSDPLMLRESPTDGRVVERLASGTVVRVIDGPVCKLYRAQSVFYWWWKIQSPTGMNGWIVEGIDPSDPIFIQPVQ